MSDRTDKQQLRGILAEFNFMDISLALDNLRTELMPKPIDFKNRGKKCKHGEDGCIGEKEFADGLEAVWGIPNFLPAHFLSEGNVIQKAIAMVTLKVAHRGLPAGNGWGSGFLVSNSLFMTNNHVIPDEAFCDKVNMQFMYQDNYDSEPAISSEFFETNEDSFFHTNAALDYTIVRLGKKARKLTLPIPRYNVVWPPKDLAIETSGNDGECTDDDQNDDLKGLGEVIAEEGIYSFNSSRYLNLFLQIYGYTAGSKYGFVPLRPEVAYPEGLFLNVIQHPQGRKKEVVVQQNRLTDVHTNIIHYKSDTDYGSSGSPVFDNQWNLMALHHAREPAESANEGMRIDKIVADLKNEFQATNPGILAELGI